MKKKNKLINILLGSMLPTTIIPSATAIGIISNKPFRKMGFIIIMNILKTFYNLKIILGTRFCISMIMKKKNILCDEYK